MMNKKLVNLCMTALLSVVSTTAWALSEVNGFYQIGSAADFKAFAELVNGGKRDANAILTSNIDLGADNTKIGVGGDYQGIFDGAGYTITINFSTGTDGEGPALFRGIGNKSIIKKLKVQGTIEVQGPPSTTQTNKHTAAITNYSGGIIRDCFVDVHIKANFGDDKDASIGGIAGQLNKIALIENCLSKIKITGSTTHKCGGIAAWVDSKFVNIVNCLVINDKESDFNYSDGKSAGLVRDGDGLMKTVDLSTYNADSYKNRPAGASGNNYVTNNWGVTNVGTTVVTPEEVASGKVCYQLNTDQSEIRWVQNIGDAYPVPAVFGTDKKQVYASAATNCQGKAEGDVTFSNTPSNATVTKHTYDKYGVCTTCGQFNWNCFNFDDPTRFEQSTKSVLLGSAEDLFLAEGWNRLQNGFQLNMKMVNDISCTPPTGQLIFNNNDWINGNFDGCGHALTIKIADIQEIRASFMPEHCGIFENVIMHGSISTSATNAGCISGEGRQSIVRNVYSDVTITSTINNDNTSGGFFGKMIYRKTVENCINAGDFITPRTDLNSGCVRIGGFAGWAQDPTTFKNCAFLGKLVGAGCVDENGKGNIENSMNISRNPNNVTCENVYVANPIHSYYVDKDTKEINKYTIYTNAEGIANGELAYLLNSKQNGAERFYQKLGEDLTPMPIVKEGALVYVTPASYRCDGLAIDPVFSNTPGVEPEIPDHQFDEDCICSVCGTMETDDEGYNKIVSANGLARFAELVNAGKTNLNGRVYNDIDYTAYAKGFIGTTGKQYSGTFDGQEYTITTDIKNDAQWTGLFGTINNATIKNLVVDGSIESSAKGVGGLGGLSYGNSKIQNIVVKSTLKFTGSGDSTCGGLFGDMENAFSIQNCAFIGSINVGEGTNVGGLVSWTGNGTLTNCYVAPVEVIAGSAKDIVSGGSCSSSNCYKVVPTDAKLANGELCLMLNNGWYQTIGTDSYPVPFKTHGIVKQISEAGYATLYVADTDVEIPAGVTANVGVLEGNWLVMKPIEGKIAAGDAVVLKGDAGIYSFVPTTGATKAAANDLKGAAVETEATGKYVLAQPENEAVGFYLANGGKIAAGKAYLELPAAGVKAFFFTENGETGIANVNVNVNDNQTPVYNLAGQRINKLQKGINIVGGKKILF